jgi:hypothetical protein
MRLFIAAALIAVTHIAGASAQDIYHRGYTTNQGTYVQPHYQTRPDGNPFNNYSTQGNVNPYTGQAGTVNPYAHQQYQQPSYQAPQPAPSWGRCPLGQRC